MKIVVTGAAGFIGSNIIRGLNNRGITDILAVDDLTQGEKFRNLADLQIADYVDADIFYGLFSGGHYGRMEAVFHEGACSDTLASDGKYVVDNNYTLPCELFRSCQEQGTRLLYASSAAVYGGSDHFQEHPDCELPLNLYGYSKLLFDQRMRRDMGPGFERAHSQLVGFRYFNVYGPREQHKSRMASVAYHQYQQFKSTGKVKLFGAYGGYGPGWQMRDFIHVDDVVAINLWFFDRPDIRGLFNLGTGRAQPFNDVALAVVQNLRQEGIEPPATLEEAQARGLIEYIDFPADLVGKYQSFTQADLRALREVGCQHAFADVGTGVARYMRWLMQQKS